MALRIEWDDEQLQSVALAYRSAIRRGLSDKAFEAALQVVRHCFPEARNQKIIVAAMLLEAAGRWGGWLSGADDGGPNDGAN